MWSSTALPLPLTSLLFLSTLPLLATASKFQKPQPKIKYTNYVHVATNSTMSYVTNSGVCETTPGVNQYSGYLNVGQNMSMFFWFIEARHNAAAAPLAIWLQGGPGCSSMIGLFQENGPCHFVGNTSEPVLNPNSWNEYANMLYIDQPIGAGFSFGTDNATSTVTAIPFVWTLMQAFYAKFPVYKSRAVGVWTESFGGHYGPQMAAYIESQNALIATNQVTGEPINLVALGINNGWYDAAIQYKSYIDYAYSNPYKQIIGAGQKDALTQQFEQNCLPKVQLCSAAGLVGSDDICRDADSSCASIVEGPLEDARDFDVYDVRQGSVDPFPPETYMGYLQRQDIQDRIGAKVLYQECPNDPYDKFVASGDDARSLLPTLGQLLQPNNNSKPIQILLWAGDADFICNWYGGLECAEALEFPDTAAFKSMEVKNYTVNGVAVGTYKGVGKLSWLRVFGAGHETSYYQPEVALQVFKQTMMGNLIEGT